MTDDWRRMGQERYLQGVTLCRRRYRADSETWEHDYCAFCFRTFAEPGLLADALDEGYATLDGYHWICDACFADFRQCFAWTVVDCP